MISRVISHRARVIPTQNTFSASFSGVYDFSLTSGNALQTVFKTQPNVVYYIDAFSVGGNITREDFLSSISTVPTFLLSRKQDRSLIYTGSFPITQFYENKSFSVWVDSNKNGDMLLITFAGILNQTANLVGIDPIKITIAFDVFAIDETEYNAKFRDKVV